MLRNGYRVPDDVSVACLDDPELLSFSYPSITAMSFDYLQAGRQAANMLVEIVENGGAGGIPMPAEMVMPYAMQIRESTCGPKLRGGVL